MAYLKSIATGNFTDASTWGLIDSTSYYHDTFANHTSSYLTTSWVQSSAFTPGAITISHIGVKIGNRVNTLGTFSLRLVLSSDNSEVSGTLVTVNVADVPNCSAYGSTAINSAGGSGGFMFLKLASPVTLTAATAYKLEGTSSNSNQLQLYRQTGVTGNWFRALVTTTTQAPATGDTMYIGGEYTGPGTSNAFTVTMNNTNSSTDFGSADTDLSHPALSVNAKGTLTWGTAAATNYYLKISGGVVINSEGIYQMGTSGTPCPRDSTMTLEFDVTGYGTWGFIGKAYSSVTITGQSRTVGKNVVWCLLNSDAAANATSLSVDTDTGWLDNDEIAVAPTGRNYTQGEIGTLNGNAGASSLTVDGFTGSGGGLLNAHLGSGGEQAEVVLLTRNVTIKGISTTQTTFFKIWVAGNENSSMSWCAFKHIGVGTDRTGVEVEFAASVAGIVDISYCSSYLGSTSASNGTSTGFAFISTSATANPANLSVQSLVTYHTYVGMTFGADLHNIVVDDIVSINMYTTGSGMILNSGSSSITNVRCSGLRGSQGGGVMINNNNPSGHTNYPDGTVDGILIHTCNGDAITCNDSYRKVISNITVIRCRIGMYLNAQYGGTIQNVTIIGSDLSGLTILNTYGDVTLDNFVVAGETGYPTITGITINTTANAKIRIINSDFGIVTGTHTDFTTQQILTTLSDLTYHFFDILFINCNFTGLTVNTLRYQPASTKLRFQRYNGTAGNHFTLTPCGNISRETTTVRTGASSVKLTPTYASATKKLVLGSFKRPVANGATLTPSVYVYEDASYNGARARLILKRNEAIGINSDTVLAVATAASDEAWEQLTDTTPAATDNGVMEFVIDCDGSLGNLFVDDFTT